MNAGLELELEREVERLKTIETTLNYLEQSNKKQLTHYLSSNSKGRSASSAKENKFVDNLA